MSIVCFRASLRKLLLCHFLPTGQAADKNKDGKISFAEFLESFREQTEAMVACVESMEFGVDDDDSVDDTLIGLDAKIPGGKYDTDLSASAKAGEKLNVVT